MGLAHSPHIVTDGLVFAYDMGNPQKSWKGAPTTNLQLPNIIDWSNTATVSLMPSIVSPIGTPVYSVTDNSTTQYLPSTRNITVPNNSNTYTLSLYILKTFGATSARLGFNTSFTGGTTVNYNQRFNSDTGVGTTGSVEDLGSWWRWQFQITNNSTGNTNLNCSFYPATGLYNSGDNATATGTAVVSAIQIEQNTFATPFVNGARSNTQAILDLTNNNTITASSLTYASDGTFSFNGVSDAIDCGGNSLIKPTTGITVSTWIKFNGAASNNRVLSDWHQVGNGGDRWIFYTPNSTTVVWWMASNGQTEAGTTGYNFVLGEWVNLVGTYNQSQQILYVNGVQYSAISRTGALYAGTSLQTVRVGRQAEAGSSHNGLISNVQIYNRALTASEIQQNFNALRGRYGI